MEWTTAQDVSCGDSVCISVGGVSSFSLNVSRHDPRPAGGWLKMERSFFLKKRRADFVAGSVSGRVVVAGGLGKDGAYSGAGGPRALGTSRR